MHMGVIALVYAMDKDSAEFAGEKVFKELVTHGRPFDGFTIPDEKDRTEEFGIYPANSIEGKAMIKKCMDATKREFLYNLKIVRRVLSRCKDDEKIFNKRNDKNMFKFRCYNLGQYGGSTVWVYDQDGEGIRDPEHLKNVLTKWICLADKYPEYHTKYKAYDVWVVPADVHY